MSTRLDVSQLPSVQEGNEVSLLPVMKVLISKRWFIVVLTLIGLCLGILHGVLSYKEAYTASSSILLQSSQKVTSQDYTKVYLDSIVQSTCDIIVTSNTTVKNIILREYTYRKNGQEIKTNLLEFYNEKDIDRLVGRVAKAIVLKYDRQTRVLTISYTAANADIASQIVNNIIEQINIYYNTQMTSDSARNLNFVKEQIKTAKENLNVARLKLALFIKRNKEIVAGQSEVNAYTLAKLELQNLQEDAKAKEDLYNSLVTKGQDLGIQAEQNTPSVIVLQPAFPPQHPLPRKTLKNGITGVFLMLFTAIVIVLLGNLSEIMPTREGIVRIISDELISDFKKLKDILKAK